MVNKDNPIISSQLLHTELKTGNQQLINALESMIFVGNPKTPLSIQCSFFDTKYITDFLIKGYNVFTFKVSVTVPANTYTTYTLPEYMQNHSRYSCNCNGWSGEIFANVENAQHVYLRNVRGEQCNTIVEVIAFDL